MEKAEESKHTIDETQVSRVSNTLKKKRRRNLQSPGLIAEGEVLEKRAYGNDQYEKKEENDESFSNLEKSGVIDNKTSSKLVVEQSEKKPLTAPQATNLSSSRGDKHESSPSSIIHNSTFWVVFFFIIQAGIYVRYPFLRVPCLVSLINFSDRSILTYKKMIGIKPEVVEQIEKKEVRIPISPPPKMKVVKNIITDNSDILVHNEELATLKDSFVSLKNENSELTSNMNDHLLEMKLNLLNKRESLKAWESALETVEKDVGNLLENPRLKVSVKDALRALKELNGTSGMPFQVDLLTAADVPMWKIVSSSGCPQLPLNLKDDPVVSFAAIEGGIIDMKEYAQKLVANELKKEKNQENFEIWVEDVIEDNYETPEDEIDLVETFASITDQEKEDTIFSAGMTKEEVQHVINARMDSNVAENIGLSDAASLFNGGEIIRTGSHATSPSITESLPLLNRYLAYFKLRFYGYGAEAALTPTIPIKDGVGQCWSFENAARSKNLHVRDAHMNDRANGRFASLSIRFAKHISPKRVVIEHIASAGKHLSAIRDFRLIGYEDFHSHGNQLDLGSFQYHAKGGLSQEFRITNIQEEIVIGSITLAIDSAHRPDFACLYRFKVLEE